MVEICVERSSGLESLFVEIVTPLEVTVGSRSGLPGELLVFSGQGKDYMPVLYSPGSKSFDRHFIKAQDSSLLRESLSDCRLKKYSHRKMGTSCVVYAMEVPHESSGFKVCVYGLAVPSSWYLVFPVGDENVCSVSPSDFVKYYSELDSSWFSCIEDAVGKIVRMLEGLVVVKSGNLSPANLDKIRECVDTVGREVDSLSDKCSDNDRESHEPRIWSPHGSCGYEVFPLQEDGKLYNHGPVDRCVRYGVFKRHFEGDFLDCKEEVRQKDVSGVVDKDILDELAVSIAKMECTGGVDSDKVRAIACSLRKAGFSDEARTAVLRLLIDDIADRYSDIADEYRKTVVE